MPDRLSRPRISGLFISAVVAVLSVPPAAAGAATPGAEPAAVPAGTRVLASGPSGFPGRVDVVGSDVSRILFANEDQTGNPLDQISSYETVPVGGGRPTTIGGGGFSGDASVAGSTFVYFPSDQGLPYWTDLDSGRSGYGRMPVDPLPGSLTWQTAVPGGGAWIDPDRNPVALLTTTTAKPDATPTELATLPGMPAGAIAATADTDGIAVVSGATVDYYSFATKSVRRLNTGTASAGGLTCSSATATAIGCFTRTEVLRIPTDGSAPTVIGATGVDRVVVGPTATAWTIRSTGHLFTDVAGVITQSPFAAFGVARAGNGFAFGRNGAGVAGVYRAAKAGSTFRLLARPRPLPRTTFQIALTAGRVAWLDDSSATYPVRSRRLSLRGSGPGAVVNVGPTVVTNPGSIAEPPPFPIDSPASEVAVSGTRTILVARGRAARLGVSGSVILVDSHGRHVLATSATGFVGLSGGRAIWRNTAGHILLRDLVTGQTRDLTPVVGSNSLPGLGGDLTAALYGRYLAYTTRNTVWRLDLPTGRIVRLGRVDSRLGEVGTAGDWVAWQSHSGPKSPIYYRNARTMGPIRSVGGGRQLQSVSQAGFVAQIASSGREVFRPWGDTTERPLPPAAPGPFGAGQGIAVDGGVVAWIGRDSYPKVAPLRAAAARPQALGAPFAATGVIAGRSWTLDQPMSQPLITCVVVIRNRASTIVARLGCAGASAQQGEAVATWNTRIHGANAPAGRYSWQLVARNASGSVLCATGTPGTPVQGTFVVRG